MYSFNIFHFYIISFLLSYLALIFGKRFIQMGELGGIFRTQSKIQD